MTDNSSDPTGPLDIERIHYLVRLMKRYDLTALDVNTGSVHVRLRRQSPGTVASPPTAHQAPGAPVVHSPASAADPGRAEPPASVPVAPKMTVIESPMVGTYYASSAPNDPPFVSKGAVVSPETIVCIIEAMKVFTDIPAGVSGTVAEILVKNGQAVEFGQPLFRVIPT